MRYKQWRDTFDGEIASSDPSAQARLWNLEHEDRINAKRGQFKTLIAKLYGQQRTGSVSAAQAASGALADAITETEPVESKWLGLQPVDDSGDLPSFVISYVRYSDIRKRNNGAYKGRGRPRPSETLHGPLKARKAIDGSWEVVTRFIWVTFASGGNEPPMEDPTAVKRELGLKHFKEDDHVYWFRLDIASSQNCYVPTCLDAGLYEAWKPPPKSFSQPWGLTRDLVDGQQRWPELLVETKDYFRDPSPVGELVSPPGNPVPIRRVDPDFMIGR